MWVGCSPVFAKQAQVGISTEKNEQILRFIAPGACMCLCNIVVIFISLYFWRLGEGHSVDIFQLIFFERFWNRQAGSRKMASVWNLPMIFLSWPFNQNLLHEGFLIQGRTIIHKIPQQYTTHLGGGFIFLFSPRNLGVWWSNLTT